MFRLRRLACGQTAFLLYRVFEGQIVCCRDEELDISRSTGRRTSGSDVGIDTNDEAIMGDVGCAGVNPLFAAE